MRYGVLVPTQHSTQSFTPKMPGQVNTILACGSGDPTRLTALWPQALQYIDFCVCCRPSAELNMFSGPAGIYDIYLGRSRTKWLYYMMGRARGARLLIDIDVGTHSQTQPIIHERAESVPPPSTQLLISNSQDSVDAQTERPHSLCRWLRGGRCFRSLLPAHGNRAHDIVARAVCGAAPAHTRNSHQQPANRRPQVGKCAYICIANRAPIVVVYATHACLHARIARTHARRRTHALRNEREPGAACTHIDYYSVYYLRCDLRFSETIDI